MAWPTSLGLELTYYDEGGRTVLEQRLLARDGYTAWCAALARSLQALLVDKDRPAVANAVLSQRSVSPLSRISRYKGYAAFHLDPYLTPDERASRQYTVDNGVYSFGPGADVLCAVLSAPLAVAEDVVRLPLNEPSNNLLVLPSRLTMEGAAHIFGASATTDERGSATHIRWHRLRLHQAVPGSHATIGLTTPVGIASTLAYTLILAEPLLHTLPDRLAIEVEQPEPLPEWWTRAPLP